MSREQYKLFSTGRIGKLNLPNRLIRSATWDPSILHHSKMTEEILAVYHKVAAGGVGLIFSGGLPVCNDETLASGSGYAGLRFKGIEKLVPTVHKAGTGCKIIAQLEPRNLNKGPSEIRSPYQKEKIPALITDEIQTVIRCFVEGIISIQADGFDGVQLHAAHGGLLSSFLSPYTNHRTDEFGGTIKKRAAILQRIVEQARKIVGDFPILIKLNATDNLQGGIDIENFPALAKQMERVGFDAIEVSGGMWDCLIQSEEELGFPPVPAPESHTQINRPEKQSYYLQYVRELKLNIPVILVGGNRDVERLEAILQEEPVDFIALCRPLISEPDLPKRWLEGRGGTSTDCISCNACIYDMYMHPGQDAPGLVRCVYKEDRERYHEAKEWLKTWVDQVKVSTDR